MQPRALTLPAIGALNQRHRSGNEYDKRCNIRRRFENGSEHLYDPILQEFSAMFAQ
jgi:hypothetical protein